MQNINGNEKLTEIISNDKHLSDAEQATNKI